MKAGGTMKNDDIVVTEADNLIFLSATFLSASQF